jgi:hypothetical protein
MTSQCVVGIVYNIYKCQSFILFTFLPLWINFRLFCIVLLNFNHFFRFAISIFLPRTLLLLYLRLLLRLHFLQLSPISFLHLRHPSLNLFSIISLFCGAVSAGVTVVLVENLLIVLLLHLWNLNIIYLIR